MKKKTYRIWYIIPLIILVGIVVTSSKRANQTSWFEQIIQSIITPPQRLFVATQEGIRNTWNHYFSLVNASKESTVLKKKLAETKQSNIQLQEVKKENKRLRALLKYSDQFDIKKIVARVIANNPRYEFKSIVINKGAKDGIRIFMPVVGAAGLVGRVAKVLPHSSRILLLNDPNSTIDAILQRSRARTLVVGTAKRTALRPHYYLSRAEYLRQTSDVKDNDIVITSGFGGLFPPGIPIGTIKSIGNDQYSVFQDAEVIPYENLAELQEVMVLLISETHLSFPKEKIKASISKQKKKKSYKRKSKRRKKKHTPQVPLKKKNIQTVSPYTASKTKLED